MNIYNRLALSAAVATSILLGACSSTPVAKPADVKDATQSQAAAPAVVAKSAEPTATVANVVVPAYLDPQNTLYKNRSVYFDFDQTSIKPEELSLIEQHGKFLASHPAVSIRIEGNTDEQGGTEYNLALGQKRAQTVLKTLKVYGAKDSQMEAVSLGEEKPKATGHDEASYGQNRRADLVYPAK
jgi:peptidoglycan-associated lipoprotein